ncbi:MAG: hypothetical protein EB121_01075 [Alphaproteobacteria bacterium]|nr:hypothetical protein [Alphaproteobacteria bacterium]
MIKLFLGIILFVTSGMWAESCATNSEGRRSFNIVSDSEMNALGVDAYEQVLADARAKKKLLSHKKGSLPLSQQVETMEKLFKQKF